MFDKLIGPEHHEQVACLLDQLREQSRIDDPAGLCQFWSRFESELLKHLVEEEEVLLPMFAVEHPEEAKGLLAEHAQIRRQLDELGVGIDLHTFRACVADDLAAQLLAHAAREDRVLYPWAARHGW